MLIIECHEAQTFKDNIFSEKPHNPMINAGAILVCSLLKSLVEPEMTLAEKFDYTMNFFKVRISLLK